MAASNLVLIGMPGSGKSTVGVLLAKMIARGFIDTDILIQNAEGCSLQEIIDDRGYLELRRIEEQVLLELACENHVIATGGSAVYSHDAMEHLRVDGLAIYLKVDLAVLEARDLGLAERGIAKRPDQSFADLYRERCALYEWYADITIDCSRLTHEAVCRSILAALS